jgi:hypothetical protein
MLSYKVLLRYSFLLILFVSIVFLFWRYKKLQKEKATIIRLASYYPYDEMFFGFSDQVFSSYADEKIIGFFQHKMPYQRFAEAIRDLRQACNKLKSSLPPDFESVLWTASASSTIKMHTSKVTVPPEDLLYFRNSLAQYVSAFKGVLKLTDWKAKMDTLGVQHEDSIHIDTRTVETALKQFEHIFIRKDIIKFETKEFDLNNLTLFELVVVLEQIKWHCYEVESGYMTIINFWHIQWRDIVETKFNQRSK